MGTSPKVLKGPDETKGEDGLSAETAGGKASNLWRLQDAGLPVPAWFCITADVFHRALGPIAHDIDSLLAEFQGIDSSNLSAQRLVAKRIAERLKRSRLGPNDVAELYRRFDSLFISGALVAVRSSAIGEDSAKDSFAGQMDTYLFVPREALVERVLACFASAFSERALLYRLHRAADIKTIRAAVIVQQMVEPRVGGVMFTANPTNGDGGEIVVSAGFGLGEGIVGALVETDTYFLDFETGAAREQEIAGKHSQIVFDRERGSGTRMIGVSAEVSNAPALSPRQLAALSALGRKVQALFRSPQDIEWAIDTSDLIFLLQSRPITTLSGEHENIFDNANVVESYPGLSTPLSFSYARAGYEACFGQSLRMVGMPETTIQQNAQVHQNLVALLNGRIYYNLSNWYGLFSNAGFEWMLPAWERALGLPRHYVRKPQRTLAQRRANLRVWLHFAWRFFRAKRDVTAFLRQFAEMQATFRSHDLNAMEAHQLLDLHDHLARGIRRPYGVSILNDSFTQQLYALLGRLIARFRLGDASALRNELLCGERGMESVEPVRSGLELARSIKSDRRLLALFQDGNDIEAIWRAIHADPQFVGFRDQLAVHLERYGDRTLHELKLESPLAEENPAFVVAILRNYLRGGQDVDSMEQHEQEIRGQAEQSVRQRLRRHPLRGWVFRWVLRRVRQGIKDRENLRLARSRFFGMSKRIYRAVENLFVEKRLLENRDDIFFLSEEEIAGVVRGHSLTQDLQQLVALRKHEYQRFQAMPLPPRAVSRGIVSAYFRDTKFARSAEGEGETLHGQGCSPGRVVGKAKVVMDPAGDLDIRGEILVAPMTDPGWVFLMVASKGLISEKGSLLSHTAIIGRELGIPTIVGVKNATRLIADGQTIEMDGAAGTVRIIQDQSNERP
jgi:pyruvate,water dikinase